MAEQNVSEEITDLETRITAINSTIDNQQSFRELEEGGSGSRFRTSFTDINKLYRERDRLKTRLRTLRMGA